MEVQYQAVNELDIRYRCTIADCMFTECTDTNEMMYTMYLCTVG